MEIETVPFIQISTIFSRRWQIHKNKQTQQMTAQVHHVKVTKMPIVPSLASPHTVLYECIDVHKQLVNFLYFFFFFSFFFVVQTGDSRIGAAMARCERE
jgi:hypothetical protein